MAQSDDGEHWAHPHHKALGVGDYQLGQCLHALLCRSDLQATGGQSPPEVVCIRDQVGGVKRCP